MFILRIASEEYNFILIYAQNHALWYSLEVPHQPASNEYQQWMFSWRYKKNINDFWLKKKSVLSGALLEPETVILDGTKFLTMLPFLATIKP